MIGTPPRKGAPSSNSRDLRIWSASRQNTTHGSTKLAWYTTESYKKSTIIGLNYHPPGFLGRVLVLLKENMIWAWSWVMGSCLNLTVWPVWQLHLIQYLLAYLVQCYSGVTNQVFRSFLGYLHSRSFVLFQLPHTNIWAKGLYSIWCENMLIIYDI